MKTDTFWKKTLNTIESGNKIDISTSEDAIRELLQLRRQLRKTKTLLSVLADEIDEYEIEKQFHRTMSALTNN